ncbi:hypothetical protein J6590_036198 [Homalodisca vitripennis]|nr:hypothetical protein J6590_036198 [Homalodisca vitripennis]
MYQSLDQPTHSRYFQFPPWCRDLPQPERGVVNGKLDSVRSRSIQTEDDDRSTFTGLLTHSIFNSCYGINGKLSSAVRIRGIQSEEDNWIVSPVCSFMVISIPTMVL